MVTPVVNVFHADQLRTLADGKTFGRGERYYKEGRVSELKRAAGTVTATVAGVQSYEVKLWVKAGKIAYSCTCPIGQEGSFCKHCVAVALKLAAALAPPTEAPAETLAEVEMEPKPGLSKAARAKSDDSAEEVEEANVIKPPEAWPSEMRRSVFLAGSIEMGEAPPWQADVAARLTDVPDLTVLDPRRDDWDASWKQGVDETPFREQVEWELRALERADVIAMYFAPETKSPISLLELGLHASSGKLIVCCPDGFWRKGNVDVVCRHYGVHQVHDLDALVRATRARLVAIR